MLDRFGKQNEACENINRGARAGWLVDAVMGRTDATFFERECARIASLPPISEVEERALVQRWQLERDSSAAQALVRAHLPVVLHLANRYRGYGVARDELVAEGNVGLLRAVAKFELRGVRFRTYATYWVRANMLSYVLRSNSIVARATGAVGAHFFFKLRAARARAEALLGTRGDGVDELLAEQFAVSVEQIRAHTARLALSDISLDAKVSDDGETTALDLLASEWMSPEEEASVAQRDELVHQVVERVWQGLDERERALVSQRLLADESLTLAELGGRFRLSRERFRQLELGVKARLRQALEHDALGLES